jgi:hypothetical protein
MFVGLFSIGVVMIEDMQLNFVVENAAKYEAAGNDAAARTYATGQLAPPVSFTAASATCGSQVIGYWPITLGIFPSVTLSASACSP